MIRTLLRLFGIVLGAISCANLAWRGFDLQLGPWLASILDGWDALLANTIGVIGAALVDMINKMAARLNWGWQLSLHDHWKHIYVIMQLYFVKDATNFRDLAIKQQNPGLYRNMRASYATGFIVASICSVSAGLLDSSTVLYGRNLAIASIPIAGFFTYLTVMSFASAFWDRDFQAKLDNLTKPKSFWDHFGERFLLAIIRSTIGLAVISAGLLFVKSPSSAILMLAIVWVLLAFEWLRRGWLQARKRVRNWKHNWRNALLDSGNISLALDMLATIGVALTLLAFGTI